MFKFILKSALLNTIILATFWSFFTGINEQSGIDYKAKFYPKNLQTSLTTRQWNLLWADSLLHTLTLDQKVGQLFVVSAYSNQKETDYQKLQDQISKYNLGGLIFFQGSPLQQAILTNRYQAISKIPLLIGIDAEWGLGMRLENAFSFPKAITMGATGNTKLIEQAAFEMGLHCKRMGVHMNFAPDADVNTNPQNPVINFRSFGGSPEQVGLFARAYVKGLKNAGILASAKHFPGHGDTNSDSHKSMPSINNSRAKMLEIEAAPFKALVQDSIASIMVGHLSAPAIDNRPNMPASISEPIIKGFLKGELLYSGLVITDALNMRGLIKTYPTGLAEVKAFKAGNDILLQTADIDIAYNAVLEAFKNNILSKKDLDYSVMKIMMAKKSAGVFTQKPIVLNNILTDINTTKAQYLKQEIFNKAVTIVKDNKGELPLRNFDKQKIVSVSISGYPNNLFQKTLSLYGSQKSFSVPFKPTQPADWMAIANEAVTNDIVIVSIHNTHNSDAKNYGIVPETINMIRSMAQRTKVIVCVFGNPYSVKSLGEFNTVVCGYEDEPEAYTAVSNILFGINASNGKLPVNTLNSDLKINTGLQNAALQKLGFGNPLEAGIDAQKLERIRPLVMNSIAEGEFPGCQILVAKKGKVVYYETFGNQRYGMDEPVNWGTIYDLASLTKVSATLQAMMLLYDQKKIDLNQTLKYYLPETDSTDKANITIKDLLLHQAGLKSFIPFWTNTLNSYGQLDPSYYNTLKTSENTLKVADNLFINPVIKDSVFKWILKSPLNPSSFKKHVYSDLGMILLQRVIEKVAAKPLDVYCFENIYKPMLMENTGFNITDKKNVGIIAPTEIEKEFRKRSLRGTVHDPNAALLGGVAGHAGLFSNAWDIAKLLQMNLNKGIYDGKRYFSPETVDMFTADGSELSHRGLGWNKPKPDDGNVSEYASSDSYGHTGYTGTVLWVDPKHDLIFVFLANRVYPHVSNKLIKNKTRKRVHDIIYQSFL